MEINDETADEILAAIKTGADKRMRGLLDEGVAATTLVRNLVWAIAGLTLGIIFVTGWVLKNDAAIETLKAVEIENRNYIRDLWQPVFKQPLPPPPGK